MDKFSQFINATEAKNAYQDFTEQVGNEVNAVVNNMVSHYRSCFCEGQNRGKEAGENNGALKANLQVVVNLVDIQT